MVAGCTGVALVVSGLFGPLTRRGPGSAIAIRSTADLLLGGTVEAWAPRWAGLCLYLPPVLAAAAVIAIGLPGRVAHLLGCLVAGLGTVSLLVAGRAVGYGLPFGGGTGYTRMLAGSLVLLSATACAALADHPANR